MGSWKHGDAREVGQLSSIARAAEAARRRQEAEGYAARANEVATAAVLHRLSCVICIRNDRLPFKGPVVRCEASRRLHRRMYRTWAVCDHLLGGELLQSAFAGARKLHPGQSPWFTLRTLIICRLWGL
jgi:hypothetical protein